MRSILAPVLAVALTASSAFAADNAGALPAGKPAGVHQADLAGNSIFFLAGAAAIAAGIAIAVSNNNGNQPTAVATTTTTAP